MCESVCIGFCLFCIRVVSLIRLESCETIQNIWSPVEGSEIRILQKKFREILQKKCWIPIRSFIITVDENSKKSKIFNRWHANIWTLYDYSTIKVYTLEDVVILWMNIFVILLHQSWFYYWHLVSLHCMGLQHFPGNNIIQKVPSSWHCKLMNIKNYYNIIWGWDVVKNIHIYSQDHHFRYRYLQSIPSPSSTRR